MKSNNTDRDLALLQGAWQQVAHEINGAADTHDEFGAVGTVARFDGNAFSIVREDGKVLLKGTFRLDATTIPRQAVWVGETGPDKGKVFPAIYSVSDDSFVFAAANDDGAPTPTDF